MDDGVKENYVRWFKDISMSDVPLVGGKCASLGEMYQQLTNQTVVKKNNHGGSHRSDNTDTGSLVDVNVPNGFALTSKAYDEILEQNDNTQRVINSMFKKLHKSDVNKMSEFGEQCRKMIYSLDMPVEIELQLREAWQILLKEYLSEQFMEPFVEGNETKVSGTRLRSDRADSSSPTSHTHYRTKGTPMSVAVRSSATCEDLPHASFAGQHDSFLNISNEEDLIDAVKKCHASLYTNRAISYRIDQDFDVDKIHISMSVTIMRMVRSDLGASGVCFTIDTESGHKDMLLVTGSYGLGENIVQGLIEPDEFYVHKPTFNIGYRGVLSKTLGAKQLKMIYTDTYLENKKISEEKEDALKKNKKSKRKPILSSQKEADEKSHPTEKNAESKTKPATVTHVGAKPIMNVDTTDDEQHHYCLRDEEVLQLAQACVLIENHYSNLNAATQSERGTGFEESATSGASYSTFSRETSEERDFFPGTNSTKSYPTEESVDSVFDSDDSVASICGSNDSVNDLTLESWSHRHHHHHDDSNRDSSSRQFRQAMDIEWAKDGSDNKIYIVQARPETVKSSSNPFLLVEYSMNVKNEEGKSTTSSKRGKKRDKALKKDKASNVVATKEKSTVLVKGRAIGGAVSTGKVHIMESASDMSSFRKGDILVADITTPDWEPVMKLAAGIITNRGGRTCHAAIIARELGIPAVIGTDVATSILKPSQLVTVCCCLGNEGLIYDGSVPFRKTETDLTGMALPKQTKMMLNIGNPSLAFNFSFLPCDGVGLTRLEFIINEYVQIHPMACLHPEKVLDEKMKGEMKTLTRGYEQASDYFISKLAQGVGTIAAAFYPRPVTVRLSDFKSNEYASLLGGFYFEDANEANPMLGLRGASRYVHESYEEAFELECKAMLHVRNVLGCRNVILMVPFCRTLHEAEQVLEAMASNGLYQGVDGLQIYMMCEIPNNVILMDDFAKLFDGFSIGSNDLTQLTLGADRDNAVLANSFNESDPGMLKMFQLAISGAHRHERPIGICGEAPSDDVEIAQYLVDNDIDSMSLSPTSFLKTAKQIAELEHKKKIA